MFGVKYSEAEIDPWSIGGGGGKQQPETDKLSNIVKAFNDMYCGLFADAKRMEQRITGEIPKKVAADEKYQNAKKNSDRQNAKIEHDKALKRVITALFKDDAQLFKQFQDNESFRGWLTDTVFGMTYDERSSE
jgi:type I restriction enzyme R subunit